MAAANAWGRCALCATFAVVFQGLVDWSAPGLGLTTSGPAYLDMCALTPRLFVICVCGMRAWAPGARAEWPGTAKCARRGSPGSLEPLCCVWYSSAALTVRRGSPVCGPTGTGSTPFTQFRIFCSFGSKCLVEGVPTRSPLSPFCAGRFWSFWANFIPPWSVCPANGGSHNERRIG